MSENTLNAALRRLGYDKETMTAHGFRSLASSILNEQHWHKDAIERQLAHGERDKIRAAYNHADYLPERRKMMQAWADYCDNLRSRRRTIQIRKDMAAPKISSFRRPARVDRRAGSRRQAHTKRERFDVRELIGAMRQAKEIPYNLR